MPSETPAVGGRDVRLLAYRAVVVIVLVGTAWFSVCATKAGITWQGQPSVAVEYQPYNALANAQLANRLQLDPGVRPDLDQLTRLSSLALQRDPTLAEAARVIGMVETARGQMGRAARAMHYSDHLTHRDLATQLWMIEYYVQRNDVPEILRHFDAAASSSAGATTVLFSVLVQALNHNDLIQPIAVMLERDPWWAPSLLMAVARDTPNVDNVADLFGRLARTGHAPGDEIVGVLVQRLTAAGKGESAARLRAAVQAPGARQPAAVSSAL